MVWHKVKSKFANEILYQDKVLGYFSIYSDDDGLRHVFSNNKVFQKTYPTGDVSLISFKYDLSEALNFAKMWMNKLSKKVKS